MVFAEHFLFERERALIEILGGPILAFQLVDAGEIDLALRDLRIRRVQDFLPDRKSALRRDLGVGVFALSRIDTEQLIERDNIVRVIDTELRLDAGFELACVDQGYVVVAFVKILIGALEDGVEVFRRDRKPDPEACCQPDCNCEIPPSSEYHWV
jgi:hypothetical protein